MSVYYIMICVCDFVFGVFCLITHCFSQYYLVLNHHSHQQQQQQQKPIRYGQPPPEIIKELAPELEFDEEGMPIMDPLNGSGAGAGNMPPFLPGMPFPGAGGEECCIS